MVHCSRSSAPMSSWTSSTTLKSPRRIPVCCSTSIWGSHIHVYFRPSCVHCCDRVLCSTYKCSPFRILLSEFMKFLSKECSLVWPLSCRLISSIMLFHICRNKIVRFRILNVFISTRNSLCTFTISIVVSRSWSCSETCSSTSGYVLFMIFLWWDFF